MRRHGGDDDGIKTIKVGTTPDRSDTIVTPGRKLHSLHIDEFEVKVTDDAGNGIE